MEIFIIIQNEMSKLENIHLSIHQTMFLDLPADW